MVQHNQISASAAEIILDHEGDAVGWIDLPGGVGHAEPKTDRKRTGDIVNSRGPMQRQRADRLPAIRAFQVGAEALAKEAPVLI